MQTVPVYLIKICVQVCIYVCVSIFVCLFIYVRACLATSQLDTNSHTSVLTFPENAMSSSQNRYIKGCKHILVAVMFSGIRTILIQKKGKQDPCCWQERSILKNTTIKVYPAQDNTNISLKHHRSIAEAKHTVCTWVFYFENWLYSLCSFLSYSVPSSSALYNLMQLLPKIWVTLLVI